MDDLRVVLARSVFFVPLEAGGGAGDGPAHWHRSGPERFERRMLGQLSPVLQELIGVRDTGGRTRWSFHWFELPPQTEAALAQALWPAREGGGPAGRLAEVRFVRFPEGGACLLLRVRWERDSTLDGLVAAIQGARRLEPTGGGAGWRFERVGVGALPPPANALVERVEPSGGIGLAGIAEALLGNGFRPRAGSWVQVHTAVFLAEEPWGPPHPALVRLARGYGAGHAPAAADLLADGDRLLAVRTNRLIAVAREGSACLGWPPPPRGGGSGPELARLGGSWPPSADPGLDREANADFEARFPTRYTRIYALLALFVLAERLGLAELAVEAARRVGETVDSAGGARGAGVDDLRRLAERMVAYNLAVGAEDPGGVSDYVRYVEALRHVAGVPRQRAELRVGIEQLLALAEARHREAQARLRAEEEAAERRFERTIATMGALAVPTSVVGALWGMNVSPEENPVFHLGWFGGLAALCAVLTGVALFYVRRASPPPRRGGAR